MTWEIIKNPDRKEEPVPAKGLGDVVADVAQPIAKAVDHVFGTNLQNCGGCKERRVALNDAFPEVTKLFYGKR